MLTYFLKQPDVVQLYMQSPIKEAAFLFLYPPEEGTTTSNMSVPPEWSTDILLNIDNQAIIYHLLKAEFEAVELRRVLVAADPYAAAGAVHADGLGVLDHRNII